MFFVYVLKSEESDRIYIGRTNNLRRRLKEHINGKNFTTNRLKCTKLVFYEAFLSKEDCIRRERYFKTSKGKSSLKQIIRCSLK